MTEGVVYSFEALYTNRGIYPEVCVDDTPRSLMRGQSIVNTSGTHPQH